MKRRRRKKRVPQVILGRNGKPVSKQYLWSLKQRKKKRCGICGAKARGPLCRKHMIDERERRRRKHGTVNRKTRARSYAGRWKQQVAEYEKIYGPPPTQEETSARVRSVIPATTVVVDPFVKTG